jgi:hypothetical protein
MKHFAENEQLATFCQQQVAVWVPDIFLANFIVVKNYNIANNSSTIEAREKYKH